MRGHIAEVQKSEEKMWGAISRLVEELQGLVAKENDSDSEHEEEASPKDSLVEMATRCNLATLAIRDLADLIPLSGMPPPSVHVDVVSVRDSVNSIVPR